jgi:hypothetical protein
MFDYKLKSKLLIPCEWILMTSQLPEISFPEFASEYLSEHSEKYSFNLFGK